MSSNELDEAMKKVSDLVHRIYHGTNEGPVLLNKLMRDYPEQRGSKPADDEED